jgi:predicted membrane protein
MTDSNFNGSNNSRLVAGVFIIGIGVLFLLKQSGLLFFPKWLFSWPMILIAVGVFVGIKNNFRGGGWLVPLIIGVFFLFDHVLGMWNLKRYIVPAVLIGVGAMLILRPKYDDSRWNRRRRWSGGNDEPGNDFNSSSTSTATNVAGLGNSNTNINSEEKIMVTAVFGGVTKKVMSKKVTGGEVTAIFGGAEIDFTHADFDQTVILNVTAVLGGVGLIVPAHWTIKHEVSALFGGVDDSREMPTGGSDPNKVLVLRGTAFMGGIEIKNYKR